MSNFTVEAVNLIQDTPWQVNPFVLDLSKAIFEKGANVYNDGDVVLDLSTG